MNPPSMEKIWKKVCDHHDVPEQVANEWYGRIQQHLSSESPARAYHNWQEMMQRKVTHLAGVKNPNIVLAAFFQYYHFDGNRSCAEKNCEVFEEFCHDAVIEDETKTIQTNNAKKGVPKTVKKLKDKKTPKRLKPKNKNKNSVDNEYVKRLLSAIKKKYSGQNKKVLTARRQLSFRKGSPEKVQAKAVPLPKFKQAPIETKKEKQSPKMLMDDVEIVICSEEDDDDCIMLDQTVDVKNIDDEPSTSKRIRDQMKSPTIFIDTNRQDSLRGMTHTKNELFYSPISEGDFAVDTEPEEDESCIILDDSSDPLSEEKEVSKVNGDSIIDLDHTQDVEDFIPLMSDEKPKEIKTQEKVAPSTAKKPIASARMNDSLFTKSEKKKLGDYNSNAYNPSSKESTSSGEPKSNKRFVIIDGSNVAFSHGRTNIFSSEGVKICLDYFAKMGHKVKAVMPMFRRNNGKSSNPDMLDQLHKEGLIVFTPCKNIPGQKSISYDDRFILQLAYETSAAVVSNDNYRDLINENPAFKKIVESRVLGYTFCDDILILPKDPYGRWGPTLDEILKC